jgi:hypothetical protein
MKRLLKEMTRFLFGDVYYAVIIGERGSDRYDLASQIHTTRASAEAHRQRINETRTYIYIETIRFRSRQLSLRKEES